MKKIIIVATDENAKTIATLLMDCVADISIRSVEGEEAKPVKAAASNQSAGHKSTKRSHRGKTSDEEVYSFLKEQARPVTIQELYKHMTDAGFATSTSHGPLNRLMDKNVVSRGLDGMISLVNQLPIESTQ